MPQINGSKRPFCLLSTIKDSNAHMHTHTHTHTHLCVCVFLFVEIDIIFGGARLDVATYGGQSKHEGAICEQAHSKYFSFEQGAFVAK